MKILYVAGPYSAPGDNDKFNNIITARYIARTLWLRGWGVICPHLNTAWMDSPDLAWDQFMAGDLEMLSRSDAIYMLPGWEDYRGANVEHEKAKTLGMPIYYTLGDVPYEANCRYF